MVLKFIFQATIAIVFSPGNLLTFTNFPFWMSSSTTCTVFCKSCSTNLPAALDLLVKKAYKSSINDFSAIYFCF